MGEERVKLASSQKKNEISFNEIWFIIFKCINDLVHIRGHV